MLAIQLFNGCLIRSNRHRAIIPEFQEFLFGGYPHFWFYKISLKIEAYFFLSLINAFNDPLIS